MRTVSCATALLSIILVGAGCKSGPSLVGKWTGAAGRAGNIDYDFKEDKTFAMTVLGATVKGDYKLDGETLTITAKDLDIPGLDPKMAAQLKNNPQSGINKPQTLKLKFVSNDEVSLTGSNPAMPSSSGSTTLKRVKEGS